MFSSLQPPNKELDVSFLVFVERYATDLLKWDILTFFARNPNFCATDLVIAQKIGRSVRSIRPDLGDLMLLGILEQTDTPSAQPCYRLTGKPDLRRIILKFGEQLAVRLPD